MNYVIQSVSEYSTGPTKAVAAWVTDQVAPPYWSPNAEITVSTTAARSVTVVVNMPVPLKLKGKSCTC